MEISGVVLYLPRQVPWLSEAFFRDPGLVPSGSQRFMRSRDVLWKCISAPLQV